MQFTKLFNSILDSTIWQEPPFVKIAWITMLAMSDRNGDVFASVPGLANRAGITVAEAEAAMECFLSPDKYSRTKDYDGRRVEEIDGGWTLLNHCKYRALLSAEERKEYNRRKQQERRDKLRKMSMTCQTSSANVSKVSHTEAEAEADNKEEIANLGLDADQDKQNGNNKSKPRQLRQPRQPFTPPTIDQMRVFAKSESMPESDGDFMFHHWEQNGWKNGSNPVKDWKAGFRKWKSGEWLPSQKQQAVNKQPQTPKHRPI